MLVPLSPSVSRVGSGRGSWSPAAPLSRHLGVELMGCGLRLHALALVQCGRSRRHRVRGDPEKFTRPLTGPTPARRPIGSRWRSPIPKIPTGSSARSSRRAAHGDGRERGQFTETWDGLDDNFMPLAAGHLRRERDLHAGRASGTWTAQYHSVVPRFAGGPSCWLPIARAVGQARAVRRRSLRRAAGRRRRGGRTAWPSSTGPIWKTA